MPFVGIIGAPTPNTFTFLGTDTNTNRYINPDGDEGQLMVVAAFAYSRTEAGGGAPASPSGWTKAYSDSRTAAEGAESGTKVWHAVFFKELDGSEGQTNFMSSGAEKYRIRTLLFSKPTGTITASKIHTDSGQNPAAQTCNVSGDTAPLLVIATWVGIDTINSPSMTAVTDTYTSSAVHDSELSINVMPTRTSYRIYNTAPAADNTVNVDNDNQGSTIGVCKLS